MHNNKNQIMAQIFLIGIAIGLLIPAISEAIQAWLKDDEVNKLKESVYKEENYKVYFAFSIMIFFLSFLFKA